MYLFKVEAMVRYTYAKGTVYGDFKGNGLSKRIVTLNSPSLKGPSKEAIQAEFLRLGYDVASYTGPDYIDICQPNAPHSFVLELDYNSLDFAPHVGDKWGSPWLATVDTVRVPFATYAAAWTRYKRAAIALKENPGIIAQAGGIASARLYDGDRLLHEAGKPRHATEDAGKPG